MDKNDRNGPGDAIDLAAFRKELKKRKRRGFRKDRRFFPSKEKDGLAEDEESVRGNGWMGLIAALVLVVFILTLLF